MTPAVDDILPDVLRLLAQEAGMAAESLTTSGIVHAVGKRVAASGVASPQDYVRRLHADPAEFQKLLEDLVVPETWFFRDASALRCLVGRLAALGSRSAGEVRVLSVGCSTGEEVYGLAIALRTAGFEPPQFSVLGIDISRRSLDLAQTGVFFSRSFRQEDEVTGALRERWFEAIGQSWRVRDKLRAGVEFRHGNLAQPEFLAGEPAFHLIFCRNVLIYFQAEARRMAVGHLERLLSRDGLLCSAPAEARIISEAGLRSLGSECPFMFRRQDEGADVARGAASPRQRQSQTRFGTSASVLPISPPPAGRLASPMPSAPADNRTFASPSTTEASPEHLSQQAELHAAQQAADSGRLAEADDLCGQVLSRNPASAEAHYLRGVVRQAQGILLDAQQSLEKALYLDPKHYQSLVQMMLLAEQRGDQQAAANYRRRAEQAVRPEAR